MHQTNRLSRHNNCVSHKIRVFISQHLCSAEFRYIYSDDKDWATCGTTGAHRNSSKAVATVCHQKWRNIHQCTFWKTIFMTEFLNNWDCREERTRGILTTSLICLKYLIFGVAVIVTLMLNVGGTQDLQFRVRLSQVLHCCGHVQGGDPTEGANEHIQPNNLKHLIM